MPYAWFTSTRILGVTRSGTTASNHYFFLNFFHTSDQVFGSSSKKDYERQLSKTRGRKYSVKVHVYDVHVMLLESVVPGV